MIRAAKVYLMALKNSFAARMAYRADFFICSIMIFILEMAIPYVTLLIYGTGSSFPGWNLYEVLMVQGIFILSKGAANLLFFGIVWNTLGRVRDGTYDLLLIKPASELFLTVATGFEPDSIGTILTGGVLMTFSLKHLSAPGYWTG
jgi:ABC-2 type transport system permease protein